LARRCEEDVVSLPPRDPDPIDGVPRPLPGSPLANRLAPWIAWFGLGRVLATAATVVVVVAGGWWLLRTPPPPTEAGLPLAATTTTATGTTSTTTGPTSSAPAIVVVHVAGAVAQPGVYELPGGARVVAALDAAGGALPGAAAGALNLAAPLVDGDRVYVPVPGEEVPAPAAPPVAASTSGPAGPLDLNRATAVELADLPGIGPATAQAIVDHRSANGPFASVDELEAVRGIGPAKLDAIRALVAV
jgi:competence protein ComEA